MKRQGGNWLQRTLFNRPRWVWAAAAVAVIAVVAVAVTAVNNNDKDTASGSPPTGVGGATTAPELDGSGVTPSVVTGPTVPPPPTAVPGATGPTVVTAASEVPTIPPTAPLATNEVPGSPLGIVGDRTNPVPPGTIADIGGGWRLQVLDVNPDAAAAIAAVNQFNEPPPAGKTFTLVTVVVGYFGLQDPKSAFQTTISAVGAGNVELPAECGVVPQGLDSIGAIFTGGVAVGNLCFVTTADDVGSLQLYASGNLSNGNKVFLDASASPQSPAPMAALMGPQPGAAATPSRLAPTPLRIPADVGDGWKATVTSAASDITDALMAENQFRDPPPDGYRFFGVGMTYEYDGAGSASAFNVSTNAVGASNLALSTDCGFFSTQIDLTADVFSGGSVSGTVCFVVPSSSPRMVIYASAVLDGPNVTFATA